MYGHVLQLARAVEQGAKAVAGVDVILRRVAEFDDVIQKTADNEYIVKVREQQADIPVCTLDDLREGGRSHLRLADTIRQHDRSNEATH